MQIVFVYIIQFINVFVKNWFGKNCTRKLECEKTMTQLVGTAPRPVKRGEGGQTGLKPDGAPAIQIVNITFIPLIAEIQKPTLYGL